MEQPTKSWGFPPEQTTTEEISPASFGQEIPSGQPVMSQIEANRASVAAKLRDKATSEITYRPPVVNDPETGRVTELDYRRVAKIGRAGVQVIEIPPAIPSPNTVFDSQVDELYLKGDLTHSA